MAELSPENEKKYDEIFSRYNEVLNLIYDKENQALFRNNFIKDTEKFIEENIMQSQYPKRMNFRCRHCEAHHVDLYYDNIYGLKQSRVLRPFLDCFTSAVATVRNDAPFKHHLKMKRFE